MKTFLKSVLACAIGTVFGFALLVFFGMIFLIATASLSSSKMGEASIKDNSILFLPLQGQVVERKGTSFIDWEEDSPFFSGPRHIGLFELLESLRKAKTDEKIRGIYIKLGGLRCGWASAEAIHRALLDFKSSGKYIQAYGEYFDEKSYLIASAADKIFIYPEGAFEFNGIAAVPLFAKGTLEKLGIQTQIFRVGEFKSAVEMFTQEKMSPENRQQTRELVNDLWNHFVQIIAERRQIEPQVLNDLASDLDVLRAHQALEHKLADEPASEEQVLELLRTLSGTEKDKKLPLVSFSRYYRSTSQGFALGKPNRIAVIFASGEIISGRSSDDYVGSEDLLTAMRQISRDKEIKGLVIRVNSPGGSALASDVIWRQTLEIKKTKPVIASFGDIAASGGYYLAAGADHIFAEANTLTGSIGVFGVYFTTQDFFDKKLGVTFDRVLTHPYADVGDGSRPMTTFERKRIQSQVEQTYQQFLRVVKQGRNYQSEEEVDNVARGRVWSGLQALQQGLVDDQGGLSEALKKAAEVANLGDSWDVEVFPREKSPFEQLMMAFGDMAWVQNLLQSEHPFQDIVDLWNRMRVWQKGGGVLALNPDQIEIR